MSRRSLVDAADAPTFTCEVCKISVRSAQKLLDHVNFSPLHKAVLEGGSAKAAASAAAAARGHRRVLYDGSKLFWRVNETLELCMYEDTGAQSVTVAAFQPQPQLVAVAPLVLDTPRLRAALGIASASNAPSAAPEELSAPAGDAVVQFLLARLQASKDAAGALSLSLQRLNASEPDPALLLRAAAATAAATASDLPADVKVRRRHTIVDVKEASKEVQEAATELRQARQRAESLSLLARASLEAFSRRKAVVDALATSPSRRECGWVRACDRVALQNAVAHTKEALAASEARAQARKAQPQQ